MDPTAKKVVFHASIIFEGKDIGDSMISCEWKSFVNGGYYFRAKISDPSYTHLKQFLTSTKYLQKARREPILLRFKLGYSRQSGEETEERTAILTDLQMFGDPIRGVWEFVAIDPPSWYLNAGSASGKVYRGRISDVIQQVINEFASEGKITAEVTQTTDDPNGTWGMMRMDPKTFIKSLLDWSCNVTPQQTNWMVASVDSRIIIKEQAELIQNKQDFGSYNIGRGIRLQNHINEYVVLNSNFITPVQGQLATQGISAVSGKYIDLITSKEDVVINDTNTNNKVNTRIDGKQGFNKPPEDKWITSIMAVPELGGGELGQVYEDYIGGRPRQFFLSILPSLMRIKITIPGSVDYHDSSKLGFSTVSLNWKDGDGDNFFLSGRWFIYGFHHRMARLADMFQWVTDVYLYRIDHDAKVKFKL